MGDQRAERGEPALGERAHRRVVQQRPRPGPGDAEPRPVGVVLGEGVDLQRVRGDRHRRVVASGEHTEPGHGRPGHICGAVGLETAEIVEADLRPGQVPQRPGRLGVEVAQQAEPDAVVGQSVHLLLDPLERPAEAVAGDVGEQVVEHGRPGVEPDGEDAGEPAQRSGEIDALDDLLLPPVPLERDQHRLGVLDAVVPPPLAHRQRQRGQQHVVDPGVERRRHAGQQRERVFHGKPQGQPLDAGQVADGVQGPRGERGVGAGEDVGPQWQLGDPPGPARLVHKQVRPAAERRPGSLQVLRAGGAAGGHGLPGGGQVRQQDPPRHPVDDRVVHREQQRPRTALSRVEPHRLRHHPVGGGEPRARVTGRGFDDLP